MKAIQDNLDTLNDTLISLRAIFGNVVNDSGSVEDLGMQFSSLVQKNLPVVFSILAAALGISGIQEIPKTAIKNVKDRIEKPVKSFLTSLAKPIVNGLDKVVGKTVNVDNHEVLTPPVELTNFKGKMAWLGKDKSKSGEINVYISGSPGKKQTKARKEIEKIIKGSGKLVAAAVDEVGKPGKKSGQKTAAAALAKYAKAAQGELKGLSPDCSDANSPNSNSPVDKSNDSGKLGRNLENGTGGDADVGSATVSNQPQAHHIVEGGRQTAAAKDNREILFEVCINLNDAANGVWLPQSSNRSTNLLTPKRVYHNWTFGKRGYDTYVSDLLTGPGVRGDKTAVIKILKFLRKALAAGKAGWLPKNIDSTASTAGFDDTDEG